MRSSLPLFHSVQGRRILEIDSQRETILRFDWVESNLIYGMMIAACNPSRRIKRSEIGEHRWHIGGVGFFIH